MGILKKGRKSAQQLVEFLLVAPFIVIFFGILTEYAYALNVNLTINQGLKEVTSTVYSQIAPGMNASDVNTLVQKELSDFLTANNVPNREENGLKVNYVIVDDNAVFIASYKYISAFTLPQAYFHFLPESFNFTSTSLVPVAFLKPNNYSNISSVQLDKIWSGTADFSSLDSFNDAKRGVMTNTVGSGVSGIAFFIPGTITVGASDINVYKVVYWNGMDSDTYVNLSNNHVYTCSGGCVDKGGNFITKLNGSGIYNFIFFDDFTPVFAAIPAAWTSGSGKVSDSSVDGVLKMALALYDSSNTNAGNYDNIAVSAYNPGISTSNKYYVDTFGSMVFVHTGAENLSSAVSSIGAPDYSYNFGSKVGK